MMTCKQITQLVTDFIEGELGWYDWVRFQVHVGMCVSCRTYLGQMRTTIATVGSLDPIELPEDVQSELLARFRDWHANPEPPEAP